MSDNKGSTVTITIPISNYIWIGNAFNEASEFLKDEEYENKMKGRKKEIESFYTKFREDFAKLHRDDMKTLTFSATTKELSWMINALVQSLECLEDWEYHTRMGAEKEETQALIKRLHKILHKGA